MVQQIVTIVNQSGKIVKSSKQLVNVFKEAQSAYNEKKAELKAQRKRDEDSKTSELRARRQLEALNLAENDGRSSQRSARSSMDGNRIKRKPVPSRSSRPPAQRGVTDSFYTNDDRPSKAKPLSRSSTMQFDGYGRPVDDDPKVGELVRRHTDLGEAIATRRPRRASLDDIDMDLAYGELPPPLPARRGNDTVELRQKMTALQRVLEEANCLQHSATAIIENLSKNPDTMAAVALTLGEISALVAKMAPGALTAIKGAFPAIIALLASPQFAIAAGVGVGITIIAFGSYKIIKKIQARAADDDSRLLAYGAEPLSPAESMDELREINRIESWRRGIAEPEAGSVTTSVEGEFVTPIATRTLIEEGRLTEADLKSTTTSKKSRRKKSASEVSRKTKVKVNAKSTRSKKEKVSSRLSTLFSRA